MMENEEIKKEGGDIGGIIGCILIILLIVWLFSGIGKWVGGFGKYEGRTAQEWFDAYNACYINCQNFRDCVEEYDSFDLQTKLYWGGVFYYCE